jgi:peroxiredoxin family protein
VEATSTMKKTIAKRDIPPARELIETLADAGVELHGGRLAAEMMKLEKKDLFPRVIDITAMDSFDKPQGASIIFI